MLSFVVLCDGPYNHDSFRPNEDERQWWGRRDALVRITHASCYSSPGNSNGATKSLTFVFHSADTSSKSSKMEEDSLNYIGIAAISSGLLCKEIAVPAEVPIIRKLRNSFKEAKRYYYSPDKQIDLFSEENNSPVLCAEILPASKVNSLSSSKSSDGSPTLSKKEIIKLLQSTCSLDFLRKHHLNGALELVAKKRNKADIDSAYADYMSSSKKDDVCSTDEVPILTAVFQSLFLKELNKDSPEKPLKKRKWDEISNDSSHKNHVIVLLLHEDYPDELPVFKNDSIPYTSDNPLHVICILGGVRDITTNETKAIFQACMNLHIPCIGANLGRTAEFTSKIISTMVFHAKSQSLFSAVKLLPNLNGCNGQGELRKLPSIRKGHISWDGHKNSSATETKEIHPSEMQNAHIPLTHQLFVIAKLEIKTMEIFESLKPFNDSIDFDLRMKLHGLIQLIISSLWRSRVGNDSTTEEQGNGTAVATTLYLVFQECVIVRITESLVQQQIRDFHLSAPNEFQILQLLSRLLNDPSSILPPISPNITDSETIAFIILYDREIMKENSSNGRKKDVFFVTAKCCPKIGDITSSQRSRVVETLNTGDGSADLFSAVYAGDCDCKLHNNDRDHQRRNTIIVAVGFPSESTDNLVHSHCLSSLLRLKYPESDISESKKSSKLKKIKRNCKELSQLSSKKSELISASLLITLFQHYAYHNRLIAGIQSLPSSFNYNS